MTSVQENKAESYEEKILEAGQLLERGNYSQAKDILRECIQQDDGVGGTLRAEALFLLARAQKMEQKDRGTDLDGLLHQNEWIERAKTFATVAIIVGVLIAFIIWLTTL